MTSQRYQDDPCSLAGTIQWFLDKEKDILKNAGLAEQVGLNCHWTKSKSSSVLNSQHLNYREENNIHGTVKHLETLASCHVPCSRMSRFIPIIAKLVIKYTVQNTCNEITSVTQALVSTL